MCTSHPSDANGNSPDENQVSSTSGSCSRTMLSTPTFKRAAAFNLASLSDRAHTHVVPSASLAPLAPAGSTTRYAGIWWPHHSCLETHQSSVWSVEPKTPSILDLHQHGVPQQDGRLERAPVGRVALLRNATYPVALHQLHQCPRAPSRGLPRVRSLHRPNHCDHVFSNLDGISSSSPVLTASTACPAMSLQSRYHCAHSLGSMTSPDREQTGTVIACSRSPLYSPSSLNSSTTRSLASNLGRPVRTSSEYTSV